VNCPFYGRHLTPAASAHAFQEARRHPFALISQHGNQCAIVTDSYAPCLLEIAGLPIEWAECARLKTEIFVDFPHNTHPDAA
jgi:hypothetical protein